MYSVSDVVFDSSRLELQQDCLFNDSWSNRDLKALNRKYERCEGASMMNVGQKKQEMQKP